MKKLSIIIPAYNEENTIEAVLKRIADVSLDGIEKEIIVVNDGSHDRTGAMLARMPHDMFQNLILISHIKNRGKGGAIKTGLSLCTGEYILIQDADMECDPKDYPALLLPILEKRADSVAGSRLLQRENAPARPFYYYGGVFLSKCFNAFFGTSFTDITGCYKVFPRAIIPRLLACPSNDFTFDAVWLPHALARFGAIEEVPVRYSPRTRAEGKKLHWIHGIKCLPMILALKIKEL